MPTVRHCEDPREYHRQYYRENIDKFRAQSRAWAKANPAKCVAATRKWRFGLTAEQQAELLSGSCEICGRPATHIDHCHATGKVRGGLCNNCNTGLGMFSDDPARLVRAAEYVKGKR